MMNCTALEPATVLDQIWSHGAQNKLTNKTSEEKNRAEDRAETERVDLFFIIYFNDRASAL